MEKETRTYKCDGCGKTVVRDFYDNSTPESKKANDQALIGWITLTISATRRQQEGVLIPETVGHACSDKCVKQAFATIVTRALPP